METITIKNVSFSYPTDEKLVLNNINTTIEESGFYLLMGPSGCGKSTLLRHLKKSLKPYGNLQGSITYKGTEIDDLDDETAACRIGYVMQNPMDQIVTDTVWHELAFGLESLGLPNDVIKRRVAEMSNFFGIQGWFRKDIKKLSGGQMQMVNLASIMAMQPDVLILDEPTSQLDPLAASDFLHTIVKINQELGTTIIICEHRLEEVYAMADQVLYMENGVICQQGTPTMISNWIANDSKNLYEGLPAAFRIAANVKAKTNHDHYPLTIRQGHEWLQTCLKGVGELKYKNEKKQLDNSDDCKKHNDKKSSVIHMNDIWFRYERNSSDVLRGASIEVQAGEWFALLGGNGAGKSTLLQVLTNNLKSYRGNTKVLNSKKDYLGYQKMVMLPQDPKALFTEITVQEELMEGLLDIDIPYDSKKSKVAEILSKMRLEGLEQHHPYDLSGGEQQRLGLGKLLLLEPKILLLDEPTKGMDPEFKNVFANIIHTYQKNGLTILMVSHDVEFCAMYVDRCAMFFDGEVIAVQEAKQFFMGNNFYTTAANRMARTWFPVAVTCQEVVEQCQSALRGKVVQ